MEMIGDKNAGGRNRKPIWNLSTRASPANLSPGKAYPRARYFDWVESLSPRVRRRLKQRSKTRIAQIKSDARLNRVPGFSSAREKSG